MGTELGTATAQLAASGKPVDESLMLVAAGPGAAGNRDRRQRGGGPASLHPPGGRRPADGRAVLVRDVTELRRRERELLTKEATIREIHHRVKNNLQTVAALLRLQAGGCRRRRRGRPCRRRCAEWDDRDRARDAVAHAGRDRRLRRHRRPGRDDGGRGILTRGTGHAEDHRPVRDAPATVATPLAMVLTELLQNALQHGFGTTGASGTPGSSRWSPRVHPSSSP